MIDPDTQRVNLFRAEFNRVLHANASNGFGVNKEDIRIRTTCDARSSFETRLL